MREDELLRCGRRWRRSESPRRGVIKSRLARPEHDDDVASPPAGLPDGSCTHGLCESAGETYPLRLRRLNRLATFFRFPTSFGLVSVSKTLAAA